MPAVGNVENFPVKLRSDIAVGAGNFSQRSVTVNLGKHPGQTLQSGKILADFIEDFLEELLFNADSVFLGVQDRVFLLFELS